MKVWCFFALLLWGCWTTDSRVAGDATETGNAGLTGTIVHPTGVAAAGAQVLALPYGFDPGTGALSDSLRTLTDAQGVFTFRNLPPGRYNVHASQQATGMVSLRTGVKIIDRSVTLPPDTLRSPAVLTVPLPENSVAGAYVYIAGTPLLHAVSPAEFAAGRIRLDGVPSGRLPEIVFNTDGISGRYVIDSNFTATPGLQADIPFTDLWKKTAPFRLNTSASGVNLRDTLYGFPMAVRLRAPSVDFSRALPDGRDLRFFKPDGTPLVHALEFWDPALNEAVAWVLMDTLLPGSSGQTIVLHYENPTALPVTAPVFDTANGYAGVWHLSEEFPDTVASAAYRDATPAGHHGDDRILSLGREGVLGRGHSVVGSDYLSVPSPSLLLKPDTGFTISAWVKSAQLFGTHGELLSMGDVYGLRIQGDGNAYAFYLPPGVPPLSDPMDPDYVKVIAGAPRLRDAAWHLVSATLASDSLRLFLDGTQVGATPALGPVHYHRRLGSDFLMGRHGNGKPGFQLNGSLDEVEVLNHAKSAEWMRILYENQKPGSIFPAPE